MNTKIRVADYLPFEEREKRYRKATDGMARGHWLVIWLIAQGTPVFIEPGNAYHLVKLGTFVYTICMNSPIIIYRGHTAGVCCVAGSPNGSYIALARASLDRTVHVWNAPI
jgi:WD40 repeat protein